MESLHEWMQGASSNHPLVMPVSAPASPQPCLHMTSRRLRELHFPVSDSQGGHQFEDVLHHLMDSSLRNLFTETVGEYEGFFQVNQGVTAFSF